MSNLSIFSEDSLTDNEKYYYSSVLDDTKTSVTEDMTSISNSTTCSDVIGKYVYHYKKTGIIEDKYYAVLNCDNENGNLTGFAISKKDNLPSEFTNFYYGEYDVSKSSSMVSPYMIGVFNVTYDSNFYTTTPVKGLESNYISDKELLAYCPECSSNILISIILKITDDYVYYTMYVGF